MTAGTAARYRLRTISDLARVAGRLTFGGPPECPERLYCLPGLRLIYRLRFREFVPLDAGGPLTRQALAAGDISVALLFTTDPAIQARHLVVLADDRGLQPAENVVPLLRRATADRFGPGLVAALNTLSAALSTAALAALDAQVELDGRAPPAVADAGCGRNGWHGQGWERDWRLPGGACGLPGPPARRPTDFARGVSSCAGTHRWRRWNRRA